MTVVGTAGHVDAGKSTLIEALTGTHPDRWAEERARGLTIDLGFAATTLENGITISFVDVPGHVRFLRNMLSGAGGVAAVLFVVAANDGWRAQSQEHLDILELLGVTQGLFVITKVGLVDSQRVDEVREQITERVSPTRLHGSAIVDVDTPTGLGLPMVREQLSRLAQTLPSAADHQRPRVWIDRSFTVRGAGTVVTGILGGGSIGVGDELEVVPQHRSVRVRGLQRHHDAIDVAVPGERIAINITGVGAKEIGRGDALVQRDRWHLTTTIDVELRVLGSLDHPVRRAGAYALHLGSAECAVTLRVIGASQIEPGATGPVRLRLDRAVALAPGDRFVLREFGRDETVGGGVVLDIDPLLPTSKAQPDRSIARVVRERGRVRLEELDRLAEPGYDRGELTIVADSALDPLRLSSTRDELSSRLAATAERSLPLADLDEVERHVVTTMPDLELRGDRVVSAGAQLGDDAVALLGRLRVDGVHPNQPSDAERGAALELARAGQALRCGGLWFATSAVDEAIRVLATRLDDDPFGASTGELRDALGTSRRFAIPLLEWFDATGRTRRRDDQRIAGPRSGRAIEAVDLRNAAS